MSTGIVSVAVKADGHSTVSSGLLAVAIGLWVVLVLAVARARFRKESLSARSLTLVAATAVVGTRLTLGGAPTAVGGALLALAVTFWIALVVPGVRHRATPTTGSSFLPTVATQALVVLASTLAVRDHAAWLAIVALAGLALGLGFYLPVLARFDLRQLVAGRGDHWIMGGALAISTLAAAQLVTSTRSVGLGALTGGLEDTALALFAAAAGCLVVLLAGEAARPRPAFHHARWSTVFPVGMYAACGLAVARVTGSHAIEDFADAWTWVAAALWLSVALAQVRALLVP
jgi:tellurite resistance protein TehA-like permease